ncbi:TetR/AcrR family transcriptional regulator [Caballeronia sp. S22]|uniref:TetR/AcrR family transcriptional regulator n=1 Tax=Caballeronia sp. S22 TaxID=3137182 RepID=UPI00353165DD
MPTFEFSRHVLPPQQDRSRQALARIVEAAGLVLRRDGIDGFSIQAVATAAGLPVGNLYRRFRGKGDILQALKEDVTSRIEHTIVQQLARRRFHSIDTFIPAYMALNVKVFAQDEAVHLALYDERVRDAAQDEIGTSGRQRIFSVYRETLLLLLPHLSGTCAENRVRVSFQIMTSAVVEKARGRDSILNALSWPALKAEYGAAALAYLKS